MRDTQRVCVRIRLGNREKGRMESMVEGLVGWNGDWAAEKPDGFGGGDFQRSHAHQFPGILRVRRRWRQLRHVDYCALKPLSYARRWVETNNWSLVSELSHTRFPEAVIVDVTLYTSGFFFRIVMFFALVPAITWHNLFTMHLQKYS